MLIGILHYIIDMHDIIIFIQVVTLVVGCRVSYLHIYAEYIT